MNCNNQKSASNQPFGFTGYQLDETGLYYAQQRYYNPTTARFNREDPLQGNPQTPPSLHRYLYAYANPTVYVDPDGRQSDSVYEQRTQSVEDVERVERVKKKKRLAKVERARIKAINDEQMMRVAESSNKETLLELNIPIDETINRAHMSACVYEDKRVCNEIRTANFRRLNEQEYDLFDIEENELTSWYGFNSAIFINEDTRELTMAFVGTDGPVDGLTDLWQIIMPSIQYLKADGLALKLSESAKKHGYELSFTGHSLGGGYAAYASIVTGKEATTFNAAGLGAGFRLLSTVFDSENYKNAENLINAFFVDGEIVSASQDAIPGVGDAIGQRIKLKRASSDDSIKQHFMTSACRSVGTECDYVPQK